MQESDTKVARETENRAHCCVRASEGMMMMMMMGWGSTSICVGKL
jgi:hypothetical protein